MSLRDDFANEEVSLNSTEQLQLQPGDLVEYWPDRGSRETAVIVAKAATARAYTTFGERGQYDVMNQNRYRLVLKGFYEGEMPLSRATGDARLVKLRKALRLFKSQVAALRSKHREVLANLHSIDNAEKVGVAQMCQAVFGISEPTHAHLFVVFEALTLDRLHFLPDTALHMRLPQFTRRAKEEIAWIQNVSRAVRQKEPQYFEFLSRAKEIRQWGMDHSRRLDGPLEREICPVSFTPEQQAFVDFLRTACMERGDHFQMELFTSVAADIAKYLHYRNGDRDTLHLLLKELGIIAPWDANARRVAARAATTSTAVQVNIEEIKDSLAHMRHDFGDLPVYTIDGETAKELDDGLSFDGEWVHVHIADPSAHIAPDSPLGHAIRARFQTTYLGEETIPMLPAELAGRFSLSSGTPTMTTSVRLGPDGEALAVKIRPGIVRNVRHLSYNQVNDLVFAHKASSQEMSINWTDEPSTQRPLHDMSESDRRCIEAMGVYLRRHKAYRVRNGLIDQENTQLDQQVTPSRLPAMTDKPTFFSGRPGIRVSVSSVSSPAVELVTESAIMANRLIAEYCAAHDIPCIYRVMHDSMPASEKAKLLATRDADTGHVSMEQLMPFMHYFETTKPRLQPGPASMLGLPNGYTNATSPLRRYADMLVQWQIERSWLRQPPLHIDLGYITRRAREARTLDHALQKVWPMQLLQQRMERGEELEFEAQIIQNYIPRRQHLPVQATLTPLGLRCTVDMHRRKFSIAEKVRVRVVELDLMDNIAVCEVV